MKSHAESQTERDFKHTQVLSFFESCIKALEITLYLS